MKIKSSENNNNTQSTNHNEKETAMSKKIENVGSKIKRIREEKGFSQESVHPNQSTISQIESGKNANPNRDTLEVIAKELGMSVDELVKNTTWQDNRPRSTNGYAICPTCFNLDYKMETGITSNHLTFGKKNKKGEDNKYCPDCGTELIADCPGCGRAVECESQSYCQGCGHEFNSSKELVELVFRDVPFEAIEGGAMSSIVVQDSARIMNDILKSCGIKAGGLTSEIMYDAVSMIKRIHPDAYDKLSDKAKSDLSILEGICTKSKVLDVKIGSANGRGERDIEKDFRQEMFQWLSTLTAKRTTSALSSNDVEEIRSATDSIKDIMVAAANGDEASLREVVEADEKELTSDRKDNENV